MSKKRRPKQTTVNPEQTKATKEGPTNTTPTPRQERRRRYSAWRRGYHKSQEAGKGGTTVGEEDVWKRAVKETGEDYRKLF